MLNEKNSNYCDCECIEVIKLGMSVFNARYFVKRFKRIVQKNEGNENGLNKQWKDKFSLANFALFLKSNYGLNNAKYLFSDGHHSK